MQNFGVRRKQGCTPYFEWVSSAFLFPLLWSLLHVRMNRARLHRYVSTFLIAAGAILTLYVANTYYAAYRAQRRLMRQWQQQSTSEQSRTQEPGLNRISIPKIGLDAVIAVIVEGTTISSLALGPGHLLTTALPGESGNAP